MLKLYFFIFFIPFNIVLNAQTDLSLFCNKDVRVGASRFGEYLPFLKGKNIGIVGNQSSLVGDTHLVDTLLALNITLKKIFSPEHGFRGKADAGEKVNSSIDSKTGLPIISLYGSNKKPKSSQLIELDIIIFDIQDVGVRFYTYISTLHYIMEACAENNIDLIVLDRPNPNGHYVDGPVLDMKSKSFIGMHPVPIVHGLTIGEYAQMINGESWLKNNLTCNLKVVKCTGWNHNKHYRLPVKPSPNLPNMLAVYLYPSICFFEGTVVSVGRGTSAPFQQIGHPKFTEGIYTFIPRPSEGAKSPKLKDKTCKGIDFTEVGLNIVQNQNQLQISWFIQFYNDLNLRSKFFLSNNFINLLAGNSIFKSQIINGVSEQEIRASWQADINSYLKVRSKYVLYSDFRKD